MYLDTCQFHQKQYLDGKYLDTKFNHPLSGNRTDKNIQRVKLKQNV